MSVFKSLGSFCFQNWLTIFIIESEWTMSLEREVWCDIPRANIWPLVTQSQVYMTLGHSFSVLFVETITKNELSYN